MGVNRASGDISGNRFFGGDLMASSSENGSAAVGSLLETILAERPAFHRGETEINRDFAPGDCKPGWPAHLNSRAASSKLRNRRNAVQFPERLVNEDPEN